MMRYHRLCAIILFAHFFDTMSCTRNPMHAFVMTANNLTKITWAHAVNNKSLLEEALNTDKMMLEADVVLGTLLDEKDNETIPIMGHPPSNVSDLSLAQFLNTVQLYNSHNKNHTRGVKLDFKTIDVFERAITILEPLYEDMHYPVWLNADIVKGPLNATATPVDPDRFLNGAAKFKHSVLSIGWTTNYGKDFNKTSYADDQIAEMLDIVKKNDIKQNITYPIRAGIAAESLNEIKRLIENTKNSTLTIWSSEGDPVDVDNLKRLIAAIGLSRVYLDVPDDLKSRLHLEDVHDYVVKDDAVEATSDKS